MKILENNIPLSLGKQRRSLIRCVEAISKAGRVRQVMLFGSHARGDANRDSDVDLCIVADGVQNQIRAAREFRRAIREIRPKPAFTLIPISPERLAEKRKCGDHFFATILKEGVCVAKEDKFKRAR